MSAYSLQFLPKNKSSIREILYDSETEVLRVLYAGHNVLNNIKGVSANDILALTRSKSLKTTLNKITMRLPVNISSKAFPETHTLLVYFYNHPYIHTIKFLE